MTPNADDWKQIVQLDENANDEQLNDDDIEEVTEYLRKQMVKAKQAVKAAKSYCDKVKDSEDSEFQALEKVWKKITPQMFVKIVMSRGKDLVDFLDTLTFKMNEEDWKDKASNDDTRPTKLSRSLQDMRRGQGGEHIIAHASNEHALGHPALGKDVEAKPYPWDNAHSHTHTFRIGVCNCICVPDKVELDVHWTSVNGLIGPDLRKVPDLIYIVRALSDCGPESDVYSSVIGHTIQAHAWQLVQNHFYFCTAADVAVLLCFSGFSLLGKGNYINDMPHLVRALRTLTTVLAARTLLQRVLFEPMCTIKLYGCRAAFPKLFLSPWSAFTFATDVFTSFVALSLAFPILGVYLLGSESAAFRYGNCGNESQNDCSLAIHPSFLACAILLKWLEFIVSLICIRTVSGTIFAPVLHAASHRESVRFLGMFCLLVVGFWNSYWSFPIDEVQNAEKFLGYIDLFSFMRVFRLITLGDFNLMELEGIDEVANGTVYQHGIFNATIDDGEIQSFELHRGMQLFFILGSILGLIVMNVYIGLLGNLYDLGKARRHQLHLYLRAQRTYPLLLYAHFLPWYPFAKQENHDKDSGCDKHSGCWIVYDPESCLDERIDAERINKLDEKLDGTDGKVKKLDEKLQLLDGKIERIEEQGKLMQKQLHQILEILRQPGGAVQAPAGCD